MREGDRCSYKDFSILIDATEFGLTRDTVAQALAAEGIDSRAYYDPPVHRHLAYAAYAPPESTLPNTVRLAETSLSLPLHSLMEESTIEVVGAALSRIQQHAPQIHAKLMA